jgi:cob(I)alamin adenosyltransferase
MKGYVQVYTGCGKGKTTASLGLALRAYGANLKIFIGQFCKGKTSSEFKALYKLKDKITVKQYGKGCFIKNKPDKKDMLKAQKGLEEIKKYIASEKYDLVILDEINIALYYKLIPLSEVMEIIDNKPKKTELILTGRKAPLEIIKKADIVTEMKEIKHYYKKGIPARKGIEK